MKVIVTHQSPDWDAISSVWLIRRFLPNWENAKVMFVPAGERIKNSKIQIPSDREEDIIERIGNDEVIHVDTGMGPLDHHQTSNMQECGASRTWNFVKQQQSGSERWFVRAAAVERIVDIIVAIDHFQEVYWENPSADYHEFSLLGILEGLKYQKPGDDDFYLLFGMECLDALTYDFENRAWAEKEIQEKGIVFETKYGQGIGIETMNDTVLKLAQKMGYIIVIRKDPRSGFVRIKTMPERAELRITSYEPRGGATGPDERSEQVTCLTGVEPPVRVPVMSLRVKPSERGEERQDPNQKGLDFTLVSEKLKKMDPDATWYLHVSKKMLLNGTTKNPKMIPTKLTLKQIIEVVKEI